MRDAPTTETFQLQAHESVPILAGPNARRNSGSGASALEVTEDVFESPPSIVFATAEATLPVVRDQEGRLHGIEAVVDKDLTAALLAEALGADALLLRTDVPAVEVDYGTAEARALHGVSVGELRAMQLPRVPWEQMSKQRAALSSGPAVRLHRLS